MELELILYLQVKKYPITYTGDYWKRNFPRKMMELEKFGKMIWVWKFHWINGEKAIKISIK